jgi:REP element-mobilizing transposase RayT
MSIAGKYLSTFYEEGFYHVYNRTNNKELLFREEDNYYFFLKKYHQYLGPFVNTFCYNLLPNHFHLVIQIRSVKEALSYLKTLPEEKLMKSEKQFLNKGENELDSLVESAFHPFLLLIPWLLIKCITVMAIYFTARLNACLWKQMHTSFN